MNAVIDLRDVDVFGVDVHARARSLKQLVLGRRGARPVRIPILRGVNFKAGPGDRVGVVGLNGSGKSSLLKVISGNYPIHAGSRHVSGSIAPLIEMGTGFDLEMPGRRNIKLTFAYRGRLADYSPEMERRIIEFSELGDKIDLPLKTYSSGMAARLAFSSAVFQRPDILLIDEVFAVGDVGFVEKSRRMLFETMSHAAITLIVSHGNPEVMSTCDRGILMRGGRIAAEGPMSDIYQRYLEESGGPPSGTGS